MSSHVGTNAINGLTPGGRYLVSVYGITAYRGNEGATLTGVRVLNGSGAVLAQTPSRYINWHDGSAPQSASLIVIAPANGYIRAVTDGGEAMYMAAVRLGH